MSPLGLSLLASLLVGSPAPQDVTDSGGLDRTPESRARIASALTSFAREEDAAAVDTLVDELSSLGPFLLPALHAHLAGLPEPGLPADRGEAAGVDALVLALGRPPVARWVAGLLEAEDAGLPGAERAAALRLLEPVARAEDLALALELSSESIGEPAGTSLRRPLHELALRVVADDPAALVLIPRHVAQPDGSAHSLLVRAIGAEADEAGWDALVALIGVDDALDRATLLSVAELARRHPGTAPPDLGAQVSTYLAEDDSTLVRHALTALGALDHQDAIEPLIELLESEAPAIAQAAHGALKDLTGLGLPASAPRWELWLAEEQRWWRAEAPRLIAQLTGGEQSESRHRLRRDELAAELVRVVEGGSPLLRREACDALGALGAKSAVPALRQLALDTDPESRLHASAVRALARIGVELVLPAPDTFALSGARR